MTGGGAKGPCTDASGILAQFEVLDAAKGLTPTLDKDSQTYWFNKASTIISISPLPYPSNGVLRAVISLPSIKIPLGSTYYRLGLKYPGACTNDILRVCMCRAKQDFASNTCFGGTFVW